VNQEILHVVGARPNFPKAAPVLHALERRGARQVLIHTGQHYDDALSEAFFRDLAIPHPDINLAIGSGTHAGQTAAIMVGLEAIVFERRPALIVVYGDVNSTVAAALVASKLGIPVAHVEAGLRSFDRTMPEEINRIVTDRLADLLFVTSRDAIDHLRAEGVPREHIHFVGNPMIDTLLAHIDSFDPESQRARLGLPPEYAVATMHRPGNVDSDEAAAMVVRALHEVAGLVPIVIPVHPRGRASLERAGLLGHPGIIAVDPMPYTDFLGLVRGARLVITDSGGLQEETTVLGVACLTMRPNTERPVTITHGTNQLVTPAGLMAAARQVLGNGAPLDLRIPELWDGSAGERIAEVLWAYTRDIQEAK